MKIADRPRSRQKQLPVIAVDDGSTIDGCSRSGAPHFESFEPRLEQTSWDSFGFETNLTSYR